MLGCEVRTVFGWGAVRQVGPAGQIGVVLEEFQGWGSSKMPMLYTRVDDPVILHHCVCSIGARVTTKYGAGVVTNYLRQRDVYIVRLWAATTYGGLGSAVGYMPAADILVCHAAEEALDPSRFTMRGVDGAMVTAHEAKALPTVELLLSALPNDAGLQQSAMELITRTMLSLQRVDVRPDGEGLLLRLEEGDVLDTAGFVSASRIREFLADTKVMLKEGEAALAKHVEEAALPPEQVARLFDHWRRVSDVISAINADFKILFLGDADARLSSIMFDDEPEPEPNYYLFLVSLRKHVGEIRVLFDVEADEGRLDGLQIVSDVIGKFRVKAMQPFEELPEILSKKLAELLPDATFLTSKIRAVVPADQRGLARRVGLILASLAPGTSVFSSAPSLSSFKDIEDFLDLLCDFFANSSLPGIVLQRLCASESFKQLTDLVGSVTSLKQLTELTELVDEDTASEQVQARSSGLLASLDDVTLEGLKEALRKEGSGLAAQVQTLDLADFRDMLYRLVVSVVRSNPKLSGYGLRKQLLDAPHVGLVLLICHLYQADDLAGLAMVKTLTDSIPAGLKIFLAGCLGEGESGTTETKDGVGSAKEARRHISLDDILEALEAFDDIAERFLNNTDSVLGSIEGAQGSDTYQMALAHLHTMDIDLLENTKGWVQSSKILPMSSGGAGPDLLSAAELAFTDEKARTKLIDAVKDNVLDFLVSYIPTINISSLEGVYDNTEYSISGLDLSGFKFRKEKVDVQFDDNLVSGKDVLHFEASDITAKFKGIQWKYKRLSFPQLSGNGSADAFVENASISLGFKIVRVPKGVSAAITGSAGCYAEATVNVFPIYPVLAKEIVALQAAQEGGKSPQKEKSLRKDTPDLWGQPREWEPVLLISSKDIVIESLALKVDSQGYAWLYNMLASIFSDVLKNNICAALVGLIGSSSSDLLAMVNGAFSSKWEMVQRLLSLDLLKLPKCTALEFMSLIGDELDPEEQERLAATSKAIVPREWTLKFSEEGPLGLKLDLVRENSLELITRTVVGGVVPNGQASRVCAAQQWQPQILQGAIMLTVNGARLSQQPKEHIYGLLSSRRPLFLHVRLSEAAHDELRVVQEVVEEAKKEEARRFISVSFKAGPLGMVLVEVPGRRLVCIRSFYRDDKTGALCQAEASRKLKLGNIIIGVNGKSLVGKSLQDIHGILQRTSRPAQFLFARDLECALEANAIKIKELFSK